jgi:peptide deformylase
MKFQDAKDILTIDLNEIELSERAIEIDIKTQNKLMREIVSALKHTIEAKNIVSLSAPAIGYNRRIFCIKFDNEIKTFINPIIMN